MMAVLGTKDVCLFNMKIGAVEVVCVWNDCLRPKLRRYQNNVVIQLV
jgi:hypothetical protein